MYDNIFNLTMQLLLVMMKIMAYIVRVGGLSHPEILILNTKGRIKYKDRYPI
jgi:hypothetical protein